MKALSILLSVISLATVTAQAGVLSNFDDLRDELAFRHEVLGASENKDDQKRDKACLKGISIINEVTSLADDIKASAKLAKLMEKTFPNEFAPLVTGGAIFSNNVRNLVFEGYEDIGGTLSDLIDNLQLNVNELPEGKDRDKAQAALNDAASALDEAEVAFFSFGDLKATTKLFSECLKALAKDQKIVGTIA